MYTCFFFTSRRRDTSCALVTGVRRVLFRSRLQIRGGREGFERRDRNPVLALLAKPHLGIARHLPVQSTERLGHLCTKSCDKRSGILAAAELAVIVGAACFEIPWQIVVGIAVAVR